MDSLAGTKQYDILRETELRVELVTGQTCFVQVIHGSAEVFGVELGSQSVKFCGPCKFAIFSWYGAKLILQGAAAVAYMSGNTTMNEYLNLHQGLSTLRSTAKQTSREGPRIIICGRNDSGKSTLCRILLAYSLRENKHAPLFSL